LNVILTTAASSAVKMLDIADKLVKSDSSELRNTATADSVGTFRIICENFLIIWVVLFELIAIKNLIYFRGI